MSLSRSKETHHPPLGRLGPARSGQCGWEDRLSCVLTAATIHLAVPGSGPWA